MCRPLNSCANRTYPVQMFLVRVIIVLQSVWDGHVSLAYVVFIIAALFLRLNLDYKF
jgi:hypothetical protein